MNIPSPSTPPRKRLIIPGAPAELPVEPEADSQGHETMESYDEPAEYLEQGVDTPEEGESMVDDSYPEDSLEDVAIAEEVSPEEGVAEVDEDEVPTLDSEGGGEDEFLMVQGQEPQDFDGGQVVFDDVPVQAAPAEPKVVRRLLPRGAEHDDTAPVPRRFSSFQTSAVSLGNDQADHEESENYPRSVEQEYVAQHDAAAQQAMAAANVATAAVAAPAVQQQRPMYVPAKNGLPGWIFSMIGFLFGVLSVLIFVKMGIMPAALGITDQKSLREAVKDERERIIKILEKDGQDVEDWDKFIEK